MKPVILVVNDDGVYGPGLRPLVRAMKKVGRVTVVVPDQERSADSHCLTLHKPIRVREVSKDFFILNGSPADCARFGILEILKEKMDLVVSGINHGYNLGEDVVYSGTVAAAMEGTLLDIPAIAFSQGGLNVNFTEPSQFASRLARKVLHHGIAEGLCLNVNFPERPVRGARPQVTRLGKRIYGKKITARADPRGQQYYWLTGRNVRGISAPGSDVAAVSKGAVSVTPLHVDITDFPAMQQLKKWDL
ncbi:MAG: 5'/3'-nucleotidase SurE [Elusimicrobia bacterium]|nr:5'/3'-nucleotidase SurE [Elusimicrobiota bacterium]